METENNTDTLGHSAEVEAKVESIASIVKESAAENSKAPRVRAAGRKPAKRGRGRPRKNGAPNKSTLERMGLTSDPLGGDPASPEASATLQGDPSTLPPDAMPGLEIPTAMLKPVLKFPFDMLRARTGFEGYNLPDEVAEEMAPLLDQVLKQYFPQIESRHTPAVMLCGTLAMFLFQQSMEFQKWKREQLDAQKKTTATPKAAPGMSFAVEHVAPTL